jgi:hypothetical protein
MANQLNLESLPRQDQRLVRNMAADAGVGADAVIKEIVQSYLTLVRSAPAALPNDPLRRLTSAAVRRVT